MTRVEKQDGSSKKTILVTDSGLGGMSIFARMAAHLTKKAPWQDISMIYFNAWPKKDKGYNHFKTMDDRARVFNNAMHAMDRFQPDMIFIACNTLSVIYPYTSHSQKRRIKVSGIVDHGVQLIHEHLVSDPKSQVIIFGTPTTIAEKSHENQLIKLGIDPVRITGQGCTNLAGVIERTPFSNRVPEMINTNVSAAVSNLSRPVGKIYAALCCTHFGYAQGHFQNALSRQINEDVTLLNPNERMADQIISGHEKGLTSSPDQISSPGIDMKIITKVFWEPERISAYVRLLKDISPEAVKALSCYERDPDLFEV